MVPDRLGLHHQRKSSISYTKCWPHTRPVGDTQSSSGCFMDPRGKWETVTCANNYNTRCFVPYQGLQQSAEADKKESLLVKYHYFIKITNSLKTSLNKKGHQLTEKLP